MQEIPSPSIRDNADAGRRRVAKIIAYSILSIILLAIIILICIPVFFSAQSNAQKGSAQDDMRSAYSQGMQDATASLAPTAKPTSQATELPDVAPRIIKTGKTTLELEKGTFQKTRDEVYLIVESSGGYLQTEKSSEHGYAVSGTFLLRVPIERFEETFNRLNELGKALSLEIASQDVTQEYIDLGGRLRNIEAEEQFYLGLIAQARTVQDMMSIRDKLSSVQLQKEQALGRKYYLENQTAYSLINLTLQEEVDLAVMAGAGFWGRLGDAFVSFGHGCREFLVGLAYALPYLIILGLLALLAWRLIRSRKNRAKQLQADGQ
jgi:type II secretory pathway pseudopilin PulG